MKALKVIALVLAIITMLGFLVTLLFIGGMCAHLPRLTEKKLETLISPAEKIEREVKLGEEIVSDSGLEVALDKYEFVGPFEAEREIIGPETVSPSEGAKFLWVHIEVKNVSKVAVDFPLWGDFILVHAGEEIGPESLFGIYYYREGYPFLKSKEPSGKIYPNISGDGWIYFEVPQDARPEDLKIKYTELTVAGGQKVWEWSIE